MSAAQKTIDHDTIRRWVEARGGFPARVVGTGRPDGDGGLLTIDFPGYASEDPVERIDWDHFFREFEGGQLAFLYQEETGEGFESRFNKVISRADLETGDDEDEEEFEGDEDQSSAA